MRSLKIRLQTGQDAVVTVNEEPATRVLHDNAGSVEYVLQMVGTLASLIEKEAQIRYQIVNPDATGDAFDLLLYGAHSLSTDQVAFLCQVNESRYQDGHFSADGVRGLCYEVHVARKATFAVPDTAHRFHRALYAVTLRRLRAFSWLNQEQKAEMARIFACFCGAYPWVAPPTLTASQESDGEPVSCSLERVAGVDHGILEAIRERHRVTICPDGDRLTISFFLAPRVANKRKHE